MAELNNKEKTVPDEQVVLESWRRIVGAQRHIAAAIQFAAKYKGYRRQDQRMVFSLLDAEDDRLWQKIHLALGQPVMIREIPADVIADAVTSELGRNGKVDVQFSLGALQSVDRECKELEIKLFAETLGLLERGEQLVPENGLIQSASWAELILLKRQENGLDLLWCGESANPRLREILFSIDKAGLPERGSPAHLSAEDWVQSDLDESQTHAVERALSAPDIFLIRGASPEKKRAVMAEICCQVAQQGGRVLIASPMQEAVEAIVNLVARYPGTRSVLLQHQFSGSTGQAIIEASLPVGEPDQVADASAERLPTEPVKDAAKMQSMLEVLDQMVNLQPQVEEHVSVLLDLSRESINFNYELSQIATSFDRLSASFMDITERLDACQDLRLYLEKILRRMTQPIFRGKVEDLLAQEKELDIEFLEKVSSLEDLHRLSEDVSELLNKWADATMIYLKGDGVHSVYQIFRKADQVKRRHTRIRERANDFLSWMRRLELSIEDYFNNRKKCEQISQQREQIQHVIRECETAIQLGEQQIPQWRSAVQMMAACHHTLSQSAAILGDWLHEVSQQSLDPEFVPLPEQLGTEEFSDIWPLVWNTYQAPDPEALSGEREVIQDEIANCRRLIVELDDLASRLMPYTTSQAVADVGRAEINWRLVWIQDLVEIDADGVLHVLPDSEEKLRQMGQGLLENLQNPLWLAERFKENNQRQQAQIAHRVAQLREISKEISERQAELEADYAQLDLLDHTAVQTAADRLLQTALQVTRQLGNQRYQELNSLISQTNRARDRLHEMQSRTAAVDQQQTDCQQIVSVLQDAVEIGVGDFEGLFPALPIITLLSDLERLKDGEWEARWQQEKEIYIENLEALDKAAMDLDPLGTLKNLVQAMNDESERLEDSHSLLEKEILTVGAEVNRIARAYQQNTRQRKVARQAWRNLHEHIPESLRPVVATEDICHRDYLVAFKRSVKYWQATRDQLNWYLNPSAGPYPDWALNLNSEIFIDEVDLNQVYMEHANVVGSLCAMAGLPQFIQQLRDFDYVLIDEANHGAPAEIILPMLRGKKIVLAGDNRPYTPNIGPYPVHELAEQFHLQDMSATLSSAMLFNQLFVSCPPELRQTL